MINTISAFEKLAFKAIASLSYEEKCLYCGWCVKRLYASYAPLLDEKLSPEIAAHTKACYKELTRTIDGQTFVVDTVLWVRHSLYLMDAEYSISILTTEGCAVLKLMEAIDKTFQFMSTRNSDLVMLMPLLSVEIVDSILRNEYRIDTNDIDRVIGHELLQREFEEQLRVLGERVSKT